MIVEGAVEAVEAVERALEKELIIRLCSKIVYVERPIIFQIIQFFFKFDFKL